MSVRDSQNLNGGFSFTKYQRIREAQQDELPRAMIALRPPSRRRLHQFHHTIYFSGELYRGGFISL